MDLKGKVWKVSRWVNPIRQRVDPGTLKRELRRQAAPWAVAGTDGRFVEKLLRGYDVEVWSLNTDNGISVTAFPEVWICRRCSRIEDSTLAACRCGAKSWGQLHFVGYHRCGALRAPWIKKCPDHQQRAVRFPGTSSAAEIAFYCPVCQRTIQRGFGFPKCECGDGQLQFNVHRAASVYTPRSIVIVNPPSPEKMQQLSVAGGAGRALSWVVDGMESRWVDAGSHNRASFVQNLVSQGIARGMAESFADQAAAAGQIGNARGAILDTLSPDQREEAEAEAVTVAMAVSEARTTLNDLVAATTEWTALGSLYRTSYPIALRQAGVHSAELIDKFPVLTGSFGFTRGDPKPGESKLVPFRSSRGAYVVYADVSETEALFIRLEPQAVAEWLRRQGWPIMIEGGPSDAREAIVHGCRIPAPGSEPDGSAGAALLTLVHSFAHRMIRRAAVFAGIERTALAELLVPAHLGFFIYAAARGDFVLGGLQAVFETELDQMLHDLASAEHRCPLDPGCRRAGGACMACLHLGEPSCRYFNSYLDRGTLFGENGYLSAVAGRPTAPG